MFVKRFTLVISAHFLECFILVAILNFNLVIVVDDPPTVSQSSLLVGPYIDLTIECEETAIILLYIQLTNKIRNKLLYKLIFETDDVILKSESYYCNKRGVMRYVQKC